MKKTFIVALFLFFCVTPLLVMAQHSAVDKGSFEFGVGNIFEMWLYKSDNYENATWIGIGITPDLTLGYFFADGFMLGTTIGFTKYKEESWTESDTSFFISPVVKYYITVSEKFLFNGKGFFGFLREEWAGYPDTYTRIHFGAGASGTYMLLPTLGASFGANFLIYPNLKVSGETIENTNFKVINIVFGLYAYL